MLTLSLVDFKASLWLNELFFKEKNMNSTFVAVLSTALFVSGVAFAAPSATIQADKQNADNACKAEGTAAGCGAEQVGTGLLKCIHQYHMAHKADFKVSAGCHAAMKQLKADKASAKPKQI